MSVQIPLVSCNGLRMCMWNWKDSDDTGQWKFRENKGEIPPWLRVQARTQCFILVPLACTKSEETCRQGGKPTHLFMQEGHREAASPRFPSLCPASLVGNERTNAAMWQKKVSLLFQLPNETCSVTVTELESEKNAIEGDIYLPWLNRQGECAGVRRSVCVCVCVYVCTNHQRLSMLLIDHAASTHFIFPRCCHDQGLRLVMLVTHVS